MRLHFSSAHGASTAVAIVLSATALASACGVHSSGPTDNAGLVGAIDRTDSPTLVPLGPGADNYESRPPATDQLPALTDSLADDLFRAVRDGAAHNGITIIPDRRLDTAMADLARALRPNEQPRSAAVDFLLEHNGIVEPYPELQISRVERGAERAAAGQLLKQLTMPRSSRLVTIGVGLDRSTTTTTVIIALQPKHLDLAPLPRALPSGATGVLAGNLYGSFRSPQLVVTSPSGASTKQPLPTRGAAFRAAAHCDQGDGAYQLELLGDDARGPRVLANFTLYCGVAPTASHLGAAGYVPMRISADEAERDLLKWINRDRVAAKLAPLQPDAQLAAVARQHSTYMYASGTVAHVTPTTGDALARARAAGLSPARLLENVGTAGSVDELHRGLMRSPGHRAPIMDARATHAGIGVVVSDPGDGTVRLYATELFR